MGTVTVALRLPAGLVIEHEGKRQLLNGWNQGATAMTPNNAGFGFTDNVDADLFAGFMAAASDGPHPLALITNDLIFANDDPQKAREQARERQNNVSSGIEGVDPEDPMKGESVRLEPTPETRKMLDDNAGKDKSGGKR